MFVYLFYYNYIYIYRSKIPSRMVDNQHELYHKVIHLDFSEVKRSSETHPTERLGRLLG